MELLDPSAQGLELELFIIQKSLVRQPTSCVCVRSTIEQNLRVCHCSLLFQKFITKHVWHIQEFNPQRVDVFHDFGGHQVIALLTFKNDIHGLEDAKAYDESFVMFKRGRTEWYKNGKNHTNRDLYGWQGTEEVAFSPSATCLASITFSETFI